ncbi:MAG: hypothetical protein M3503_00110 [Actinomycetota bacterium]|nr:hypothetical protein [Actinomycetota bacterium]
MTDDEKNPADRAIELLLFAPLGFALSARELLPELVERGRQQVTGQVTMARMIGQFAVQQGSAEAEKAFIRARSQAQTALEQLGVLDQERPAPAAAPAPPAPAPAAAAPTAPSVDRVPTPVPVRDERSGATPARAGAPRTSATSELAIPDYDSLSASQVLPRLSALSDEELEAVRAHEASHRGRKTILSKVAQLQGS